MTYGELKLASLQKMFHDIKTLEENEVTKPYLDKMEYVANCAITRVCLVGAGIRKRFEIFKCTYPNMIKNFREYHKLNAVCQDDEDKVKLYAENGRSMCVKLRGKGSVEIYVLGEKVKEHSFDTDDEITYKTSFTNSKNSPVTVIFKTTSNLFFSYPAIYSQIFSDEEIPEYGQEILYNFKELVSDFYKFDSDNSVFQDCDEKGILYNFKDENTFSLKQDAHGKWSVPYIAYPNVITKDTPDDTQIMLPYELCLILPFYIASELYLEDDSGLSIGWRNKFESSLSEYAVLKKRPAMQKYEVVESVGGIYGTI